MIHRNPTDDLPSVKLRSRAMRLTVPMASIKDLRHVYSVVKDLSQELEQVIDIKAPNVMKVSHARDCIYSANYKLKRGESDIDGVY